ncbi:MAG: MarR family transcriptional regulator [Tissierellales bacterium]|jgi:DNA-binding MarR family transcriptional regulator|nr:MarR family transcriptional regulator [Tissierellales bacterium]
MAYRAEDSIELLLSRVLSKWRRTILKEFKKYDMTTEQWSLLNRLWEQEGISQTKLAQMTSKDLPTITRILNKIENKELIVRKSDPNDRRASLIFLTEKGRLLEDKLNPIAKNISERALENISGEDIDKLKKVLNNIFMNLEEM